MIKLIFSKKEAKHILDKFNLLNFVPEETTADEVSIIFNEPDFDKLNEVLAYLKNDQKDLIFQTTTGYAKVPIYEMLYFESFGNEVDLHTLTHGKITIKEPLYQIEKLLLRHHFVRIGKSYIVNLKKIVLINPTFNARLDLELVDQTHIQVSRTFVKYFKEKLGIK